MTLSVLAALLYGLWHLTRAPSLTISTVEIEAGETVSSAELEEVINQALAGTYFALVPRRFTYTLSLIHI